MRGRSVSSALGYKSRHFGVSGNPPLPPFFPQAEDTIRMDPDPDVTFALGSVLGGSLLSTA